ncbi:contact-dependent growth inhibition system immunity protein [Amorphus orientalis]|uniref:CdiI family contact-dependent growth inhibition immunity protein n=1 Tax=Amorphus orientalis TaxID=649198 RepID=A0AAE3VP37_9HYPH|nr:contact-dependent growth inhibition system immunity protein [Amorphus orientalis]MDQ0315502.1 hypothetical protein [Amorphus orientalis]
MTLRKPVNPPLRREYKAAAITAFKKFYRIHSWAVWGAHMLDPDGIDADHPPDLDDSSLGAAAREALLASRFIGPDHPDRERIDAYWKNLSNKELLDRFKARAGVKTHSALYTGVGEVRLILEDGIISLRPLRYEGRGGFGHLRGAKTVELPETVSDEELGAAIRHLVDVSRRPWRY